MGRLVKSYSVYVSCICANGSQFLLKPPQSKSKHFKSVWPTLKYVSVQVCPKSVWLTFMYISIQVCVLLNWHRN